MEALRAGAPDVLVVAEVNGPAVAAALLEAGADVLRHVSGAPDPDVVRLCADAGAGLMVGVPPSAGDDDVAADASATAGATGEPDGLAASLGEALAEVDAQGLPREATVLDPGLGFARTTDEALGILGQLGALRALGRPILLDPTAGGPLAAVAGPSGDEQLAGSLAVVGHALRRAGPCIVQVPDVETVTAVVDYLAVAAVLSGHRSIPEDLMLAPNLRRQPPDTSNP